jgi:homocitrate synthase NifV
MTDATSTPQEISILDTTLRDGVQTPDGKGMSSVQFSLDDMIIIARLLDRIGVEHIELPYPATSDENIRQARELCNLGLRAETVCLCRANKTDIDKVLEVGPNAVIIFTSIDPLSLEKKYKGMSLEEATRRTLEAIEYAKKKTALK